ncbi:MAG TPA: hypothetical protein VGR37_05795 [Longimicrobiaceae bacterium]|nr:hypothetical protein [Longimicrobiaceae bacterium]
MRWHALALPLLLTACATAPSGAPMTKTTTSAPTRGVDGGAYTFDVNSQNRPSALRVPASVDRAWAELPSVYEELGLGGGVLDPATHLYGQRGIVVRRRLAGNPVSQYLDCGSAVPGVYNANTYAVSLSVVSQLKPRSDGFSELTTQVEASAQPASTGGGAQLVRCASNGTLERRLQTLLSSRLNG